MRTDLGFHWVIGADGHPEMCWDPFAAGGAVEADTTEVQATEPGIPNRFSTAALPLAMTMVPPAGAAHSHFGIVATVATAARRLTHVTRHG